MALQDLTPEREAGQDPDKAINREQFRRYEGKTYSIVAIYDVTVFVKSKRKKKK